MVFPDCKITILNQIIKQEGILVAGFDNMT